MYRVGVLLFLRGFTVARGREREREDGRDGGRGGVEDMMITPYYVRRIEVVVERDRDRCEAKIGRI